MGLTKGYGRLVLGEVVGVGLEEVARLAGPRLFGGVVVTPMTEQRVGFVGDHERTLRKDMTAAAQRKKNPTAATLVSVLSPSSTPRT